MKDNKFTIHINKPPADIFAFVLNPQNTPKWIDSLVIEQTNERPLKVGTVYRNQNKQGEWHQLTLTELTDNTSFEMTAKDNNYQVRYTLSPLDKDTTELEYYIQVTNGEIPETFIQNILEKLKIVLES